MYMFVLQEILQLYLPLLYLSPHKIWAIFNRDLDWNVLDVKERTASEAKGKKLRSHLQASLPKC